VASLAERMRRRGPQQPEQGVEDLV
jgi:hypothetical protein